MCRDDLFVVSSLATLLQRLRVLEDFPSVQPVQGGACECCTPSGARWLAVRFNSLKLLVVCAHTPYAGLTVYAYRDTLDELSVCLSWFNTAHPFHSVVPGVGANVSLACRQHLDG